MRPFIAELFENPQIFLIWVLVAVFSICCHEFMHAWTALRQGDPTAADAGHLTLNPLKQMGLFSLLMLAICGIAWGAVPVRPEQMRYRYSDALVAFAGPATNYVLFLTFGIALYFVGFDADNPASILLQTGSVLNAVLFLFNMLPIPGFDGFAILRSFIPWLGKLRSEWVTGLYFLLFFLIFFSFQLLWQAAGFLVGILLDTMGLLFG